MDNISTQILTKRPIPATGQVLKSLLRADFKVQWRNRRASLMSIVVPVIFIIAWKSLIPVLGGPAVLAICISIGLPAIGLMGYSMVVARDRERGVFQRLRAAPIATWTIMISRITVQLVVMLIMTLVTYVFAYYVDHIAIAPLRIFLLLLAALLGGLSFLALGQFVVGFVKSSEAVNAATRLIYFPLAVLGAIGEIGVFGHVVQQIVVWSPVGTTKDLVAAAINPAAASSHVWLSLLVTIGYAIFFAAIGIQGFTWTAD